MPKVLISVVSHGQEDLIKLLLTSVDKFLIASKVEVEIVVTENLTADWTPKSKKFKTTFISNLRSKGFGANHNAVFEARECDYYLVVNPDIRFFEKVSLDRVIAHLVASEIKISSPVILNTSMGLEDYKRSDITALNLLRRKLFRNTEENFDWFAGMFLILESSSFKILGGFDPKYRMYVEDCDLCMRGRKLGYKLEDVQFFSVIHDARRGSHRNIRLLYWHLMSILKYILGKGLKT